MESKKANKVHTFFLAKTLTDVVIMWLYYGTRLCNKLPCHLFRCGYAISAVETYWLFHAGLLCATRQKNVDRYRTAHWCLDHILRHCPQYPQMTTWQLTPINTMATRVSQSIQCSQLHETCYSLHWHSSTYLHWPSASVLPLLKSKHRCYFRSSYEPLIRSGSSITGSDKQNPEPEVIYPTGLWIDESHLKTNDIFHFNNTTPL